MNSPTLSSHPVVRYHLHLTGVVQGVGFRPWVYRHAHELSLTGAVRNDAAGLSIDIEGAPEACDAFQLRLENEPPPHARIRGQHAEKRLAEHADEFCILPSDCDEPLSQGAGVMPDIAPCTDCLHDILNPDDRRYRYPFTNCTQCGPRYTIIDRLPYDRAHTSMAAFPLCPECQAEYESPDDRRFHAQPTACPVCGPQLCAGDMTGDDALQYAETVIREGGIAAVKGLGGFHLICDARSRRAVETLRMRKWRPAKPFALMCRDLKQVETLAHISEAERTLLQSPEAPIVLVLKRADSRLTLNVAPNVNLLGVMLPSTPLHHLLARDLDVPLVATSGNRTDEPICIDNEEAQRDLVDIADVILEHDRAIRRAADDSIFRVMHGVPVCIRNARGTAPLSLDSESVDQVLLAVGGRQKNAIALQRGSEIILGPYLGQLDNPKAYRRFEQRVEELPRLYAMLPERAVCDLHPDDEAAQFAREQVDALVCVQHHHAHVVSCMVEHGLAGEVLGVSWDGTGYGGDGTVWGGEFLQSTRADFQRVGHLRPFPLPGGEAAVREPLRCALGICHAAGWPAEVMGIDASRWDVLQQMLEHSLNCPLTTSAGRLFDAVAGLLVSYQRQSFEGEAAMQLESLIRPHDELLPLGDDPLDWAVPVYALIQARETLSWKATAFHNTLAEMIVRVAERVELPRVILTGGCFQNAYLTERTAGRLQQAGFDVYQHQQVPSNDGGLAVGQIAIAAAMKRNESCA